MIALWHQLPPQFEAQLAAVAGRASAYHFDDGHDDALRAADALEAHGLRGVFFVVSGWVGRPGWVSAAQLQELVARGHEVGNHTYSHPVLTRVPAARRLLEVRRGQMQLADACGHLPRRFAWPYGAHDRRTDAMVRRFGFVEVRDIDNVVRSAARLTPEEYGAAVP